MFGVSHENLIDSKHIFPAIEAKDDHYLDNSTLGFRTVSGHTTFRYGRHCPFATLQRAVRAFSAFLSTTRPLRLPEIPPKLAEDIQHNPVSRSTV